MAYIKKEGYESILFSLQVGCYLVEQIYPRRHSKKSIMKRCFLVSSRDGNSFTIRTYFFNKLLKENKIVKTHSIGSRNFYIRYIKETE
mgnify:CR=1 FL=1